ncbi:hypothetical protein [Haloarchaeobius sp. TZWWS8]|uniref:hypothetical protein n=1 Tax=Haloarchaeobius sp. TZWWS8 TaxID=3446121 RepID=UPI003EB7410B
MALDNSSSGGEWRSAPLRFVVWALAFVLLGRLFTNNSLYDLRQLRAEQVLVRLGSLAVVGLFVYWFGFVARRDIAAIVLFSAVGFMFMWTLPLIAIRIMGYGADAEQLADARRWKSITEGRKFD